MLKQQLLWANTDQLGSIVKINFLILFLFIVSLSSPSYNLWRDQNKNNNTVIKDKYIFNILSICMTK